MDINLSIKANFTAVYLINGKFIENAKNLIVREDEAIYITALPLSAALLPYTVQLAGTRIRANAELAKLFKPTPTTAVLVLSPRYNYIYSTATVIAPPPTTVRSFFNAVKSDDYASARKFLSDELSAGVTDEALADFFSGADDILENEGYVAAPQGSYFLMGDTVRLVTFKMKGSSIDDILENDDE